MPRCPMCYRRLRGERPCPRDGGSAPASSSASALSGGEPPRLEGLAISALLGAGGFALVWAGRRETDNAPVAVKVARAATDHARDRLFAEAAIHRDVGPPAVPALERVGQLDDGRAYLVMEHLQGPTLAAWLERRDAVPALDEVANAAAAILAALGPLHERGYIHRDLKPENIILSIKRSGRANASWRARLLDLGLARRSSTALDLPPEAAIAGTLEYMSPEQLRGEAAIDARSDLYSFGVILYELLTLRPPFVGDAAQIEHGHRWQRPPRPRQFAAMPEEIEHLVLTCLAKAPAHRPASAGEVRRSLHAALTASSPTASSLPPATVAATTVLSARTEPAVVLVAEGDLDAGWVAKVLADERGLLARQQGGRFVSVFRGLDMHDPVDAAVAAGNALVHGTSVRVALHVSGVTVRHRDKGVPMVLGAAVDRPDKWLPQVPWRGLLVTESLAQTQPPGRYRPAPGCDGFFVCGEPAPAEPPGAPLVGRDALVEELRAALALCQQSASPALVTVWGETGLGKSRLAAAAIELAAARDPDAVAIHLRGRRRRAGSTDEVARELTEALRAAGAAMAATQGRTPLPGVKPALVYAGVHRPLAEAARLLARNRLVVLVLDDAHLIDDNLLDEIEYAALDGKGVALTAIVFADPDLEAARPAWGKRAHRHTALRLAPLDGPAAKELAAELLRPAEYPPAAVLERLAQWSGGNPFFLTKLVAQLKDEGFVKKRATGDSWYVTTADLDRLPGSPVDQWLANRELDEMSADFAACVRLCSVLGTSFLRAEGRWVQDQIEKAGAAGTAIDMDLGLDELVRLGVLETEGDEWLSFHSGPFQSAVYKLLGSGDKKAIHGYGASFWQARVEELGADQTSLAHLARHCRESGELERAARVYGELGAIAEGQRRYAQTDLHFSAALALLPAHEAGMRREALRGRGKARCFLHRIGEAIEDLHEAQRLAAAAGDREARAELLLFESTVADMAEDFDRSARLVQEAGELLQPGAEPRRALYYIMCQGRSHWRQGKLDEAIALLTRASTGDEAAAPGYETKVVALLLLGPALVVAGRHDEAERRFAEVIEICTAAEDWLHLCAAYGNRMFLRSAQNQLDEAAAELRRTIRLAREAGHPGPERISTHNLAEILYNSGRYDEALPLAERSHTLHIRFSERPLPYDALLLARIHAARGDHEQSRLWLAWIEETCDPNDLPPPYAIIREAVAHVVGETAAAGQDAGQAWPDLVARAERAHEPEILVEVLWWQARAAISAQRFTSAREALERAQARLSAAPTWREPVRALQASLAS